MALTPTKMTASASRRQQACNNNQVPSTTTNDTASITCLSHPSAADANKYSNKNDYRKNDEYSNLLHNRHNYCHQNNNNNNAFTIPHGDDNLPTSPSPPLANSQTTARAKNDKGGNNWKEEGGDENNNNGVGVPPTPTKRNDKSITPRSALSPQKLPGVAKSDGSSNNNISTLGGERRRRERKASAFKDDSDSEGGKRRVAKRKKTGIGKNAFTSERSRDRNKQSNVSITEGNATTTFSRPRRSAAAYTNDGKVLKGDRKKPAANISPTTKSTGRCVNLYLDAI